MVFIIRRFLLLADFRSVVTLIELYLSLHRYDLITWQCATVVLLLLLPRYIYTALRRSVLCVCVCACVCILNQKSF